MVVLLLLVPHIVCGGSVVVFVLQCIIYVLPSFAIILKRRRKLIALFLLSSLFLVTVSVLWLLLTVPWLGLQHVIVVFPDTCNTH